MPLRVQGSVTAPSWPYCGLDAAADGVGCQGRSVEPHTACLAHLSDADRSAYFAGLRPGADLDHSGTHFTEELLGELLAAVIDPATDLPWLGQAVFVKARFSGDARFGRAQIDGDARFDGAQISGNAQFSGAKINGDALFPEAKIHGECAFNDAEIGCFTKFDDAEIGSHVFFNNAKLGHVLFHNVKIGGNAYFFRATISDDAWFEMMEFGGDARFDWVNFGGNLRFVRTVFARTAHVGPLVCAGVLDVSEAVFQGAATIEAAAVAVECWRTRWASTAALRLRHAVTNLSDAVLEYPVSLAAHARPFTLHGVQMLEAGLTDPRVRVVSLRGVDAAHLVLTDVDLTACLFAGTIHLDQLRLEGRCLLATTPSGLRRRGVWPVRWTSRRTLAEEQHWRAARSQDTDGWMPVPEGETALEPAALAPVYRQLRKAFEDGKDEPGAADFYYGEMEMRRHDHGAPRAERALLAVYWALSGYGLRASRALGWLLAAMTATVLAMMLWGLPRDAPTPKSVGTLTGRSITMTTDTPDPVNPNESYAVRLSSERFEESLRVVINSVIFRSSGQELTTAGTYTEMVSRLAEPVLLGFAVLAIRGRVKR
ncbi:pentapeptide repeat-containing protein [Streptomyces sp. NPDC001315]|uniref:pentapeptide repeat-containing protein n=1 Tax=Streptomyces sp. NPDC001315 TaxID=3364562 RepID=UPI003685D8F7